MADEIYEVQTFYDSQTNLRPLVQQVGFVRRELLNAQVAQQQLFGLMSTRPPAPSRVSRMALNGLAAGFAAGRGGIARGLSRPQSAPTGQQPISVRPDPGQQATAIGVGRARARRSIVLPAGNQTTHRRNTPPLLAPPRRRQHGSETQRLIAEADDEHRRRFAPGYVEMEDLRVDIGSHTPVSGYTTGSWQVDMEEAAKRLRRELAADANIKYRGAP